MTNFTLQDTLGATRAIAAFSAILFAPGYLIGMATDLFSFRNRSMRERTAWAIALSFASMPIFTQLAGRLIGIGGVAIAADACALATLTLLIRERQRIRIPSDRYLRALLVFLLLGSALLVAQLLDFQFGNRLHLSVTVLDQEYRVGFTNAIARTGIPPSNPFYHPGQSSALRYYYFWYSLCAVCMRIAHVSARQALIASSVWANIGLTALIALYLRHFLSIRRGLNRQILTATLLLTVTGADLIPVFYNLIVKHDFGGETEWWSADQIASWMDTLLWVPNHAAALIGCLTVFLLLWRTLEARPPRQKTTATLLAAMAAASSFGLSIYVTACLAMMLTAWVVRQTFRNHNLQLAGRVATTGALSLILLVPFLRDLLHAPSGTEGRGAAGPTRVLIFGIRKMLDPAIISALPRFAHLQSTHPELLEQLSRLVLLLPGYALELGFAGAILVLAWIDRKRLDEPRRTALFLALTGLAIVSVIRSAVIGMNDFGARASLLPCFFLLLLGTGILLDLQNEKLPIHKLRSAVLAGLLVFGFMGTAFQALNLRFFIPFESSHRAKGYEDLAETVFDTRAAFATAEPLLPPNAIVQSDPTGQGSYFYVATMLFAPRAMATDAADDCGAVFGGDQGPCHSTQTSIRSLFHIAETTPDEARAQCQRIGIQYLLASSRDAAWQNPNGWVWTLPRIAGPESPNSPGRIRIVQCSEIR